MLNIPKELDFLVLHSSTLSELITPRRILSISSKYCIHHFDFSCFKMLLEVHRASHSREMFLHRISMC